MRAKLAVVKGELRSLTKTKGEARRFPVLVIPRTATVSRWSRRRARSSSQSRKQAIAIGISEARKKGKKTPPKKK
jgi:hypothetical protein